MYKFKPHENIIFKFVPMFPALCVKEKILKHLEEKLHLHPRHTSKMGNSFEEVNVWEPAVMGRSWLLMRLSWTDNLEKMEQLLEQLSKS